MGKYKRQKHPKRKRAAVLPQNAYYMPYPNSLRYKSRQQSGGFLSRYDFAYAGRDTVNQAAHHVKRIAPGLTDQTFDRARDIAPNLIRTASREVDAIAARHINQITRQTGQEIQRIAPPIIKGATEELYKTPFRLLGQLGRRKYKQMKARILRRLKRKR